MVPAASVLNFRSNAGSGTVGADGLERASPERGPVKRALLLCVVAGFLTACSKPEPINENHTGELVEGDSVLEVDNSLYDEYAFKAAEGMTITVTMTSEAFDTYLHLIDPGGNQIATNDDADAAGGTNSQIVHTAAATGEYKVYANSLSSGENGAYSLNIVTAAGN